MKTGEGGERTQVVAVRTPTRAAKARLAELGLDLTEHGRQGSLDVVLHGERDARVLRANGFDYDVEIADLARRGQANRRADRAYAARVLASDLPSGRDTYRRLPDYELELKELAMQYPSLVRPLVLPNKSVLGRDVNAIEITANAAAVADGKPIFLNMGVHHAREWPSSEHAMEFAYDLLRNYGADARATRLVDAARTIVLPIVNPDGFNLSREGSRPPGTSPFDRFDYEMKRKNCAIAATTPEELRTGTCEDNPAGRLRGTDLNRNYGGLWGGSGASTLWYSDTYRGDGPFSEPEVQNVRRLQATRPITNLITNHTYSNLVLRPPGVEAFGFPLEEPEYDELGAALAAHNGYRNQPGFQLYDTTGAAEDWTFWTAGSIGFTFEIGPREFHPPFATGVVAEYLGRAPAAGAGLGGNREAYYTMLEATAAPVLHARISGEVTPGARLTLRKTFLTSTSPVWQSDFGTLIGDPIRFEDTLEYTLEPAARRFTWHVNPSTRPVVAGRLDPRPERTAAGRRAAAQPGRPAGRERRRSPRGAQRDRALHRAGAGGRRRQRELHGPRGVGEPGHGLGRLRPRRRGRGRDGFAAGPPGTTEDAVLIDPPPGEYRAVLVAYDQVDGQPYDDWTGSVSFAGRPPTTLGERESWTLTCTRADGTQGCRRRGRGGPRRAAGGRQRLPGGQGQRRVTRKV